MTNDVNETKTKKQPSTTKQAADAPNGQPVTKDKNQDKPLTKAGCVWKMVVGLLIMAASAGVFIACAYAYAHHNRRGLELAPYTTLFFIIGLSVFLGGLVSLIKLCKKPSNSNTSTPTPPQEKNKNCDNCKTSCDSDANSCNISTAINIEDSKDFTDNKHTNKQ